MIVVTGKMRTGTSACAAIAHQAGIIMGRTMLWPRMGDSQIEWEDMELGMTLANAVMSDRMPDPSSVRDWFKSHIGERIEHYAMALANHRDGVVKGWGLKSPYLAPYLDEWREAAEAHGEPVHVVVTRRDDRKAERESLERAFSLLRKNGAGRIALERGRMAQCRIGQALETITPDFELECEQIRSDPNWVRDLFLRIVKG